ncbi:non-hydrolyzing UDP-N-acetylglucosamine 2-epimerase [Micavibrio aeruginosavorus]|uniref:UDP-N-acetylglucosamine 2-epimerase n=1 Tax=Micavibrio aeruginosavorus EPB TaxID=349215 RepID=M4VX68_9BACT|nr:UDP-N-acetylglucosamine 2-epimerase (non-hydrolyzing) [Micavibrio aeruginosavorus]AGH97799.1 UDP-N-acetylglucosamine 2-epimerase [Micavibrio aeruginosavorus EPB]
MKICTIVGARPQFIKAAVVSRAFAQVPSCTEIIIHTGQHYDANMSDVFFAEMEIPKPVYNLSVGGGTHGQNTGRMIEKIEGVLLKEKPDVVLVYGDTDSTLAGTLAAVKIHISVAHVEAGLRSFNRKMPEEINRILTDHASDILFVPTKVAENNLKNEGVCGDHVQIVGDVMLDAARFYGDMASHGSNVMQKLSLHKGQYILATIHRAENTNDANKIRSILKGFSACNDEIILPIHPRTQKIIGDIGVSVPSNVRVIDPVGYLDMVALEKNAKLIATDSGGVQKEAYFHGVPCITLRDQTEWVELVDAGANILVGADSEKIGRALNGGRQGDALFRPDLYGKGDAAQKIVSYLSSRF